MKIVIFESEDAEQRKALRIYLQSRFTPYIREEGPQLILDTEFTDQMYLRIINHTMGFVSGWNAAKRQ